jgi:hypothetical protein
VNLDRPATRRPHNRLRERKYNNTCTRSEESIQAILFKIFVQAVAALASFTALSVCAHTDLAKKKKKKNMRYTCQQYK